MANCFFCGADTPLQYRRPGLLSALPADKRGRFGSCPDHVAEAEAKLAAAIGAITPRASNTPVQPRAKGNRKIHADTHEPKQGR